MSGEDSNTGLQKRPRKFARYLLAAVASLLVVALAAHLIWKYSGSNQWKLVSDRKGIQVYARKVPGHVVMQFKGIKRVTSGMDPLVALLLDPEAGGPDADDGGSFESVALQKVDEQRGGAGFYSFKWKFPFHFQPRHYVVKATFTRDPRTKEVFETVEAAPNHLPPDDCCVRIQHMLNTWRLTPVENGQIQIEYVLDAPGEGFFPYVLDNAGGPSFVRFTLAQLPTWLKNDRYRNAHVGFLAEK
ncbi:MAG: hypothetical protein JWO56_3309 [Acidobacteria bacterium]|nr:hypothetical protein [Acidobacteriota bacterium]